MRFGAALAALGVLVTTIFAMPARDAPAFNLGVHEFITAVGLGPPVGRTLSFLRPAMVDDIADEHARMDAGFPSNNIAEDQRHFDDCEFDGAAEFIGARYRAAGRTLRGLEPFDATDMFGEALHPAQDLYAHANWVEMGFPLADNPATDEVEVTQRDLLDLSGAQSSLARPWGAPAGGGVVRNGILLGADDWNIPAGWSIDADGGGRHIPTLIDPQGETRGRLLVTGEGTADDECDVFISGPPGRRAYNGLEHGVLNKDGPNGPKGARAHRKAMALATLQTGYEWCRLVRQAALQNRDGLLLTTWVRGGGNPHPANTPCAAGRAGPTSIVVTVQSVRVLDSGDDNDNDPGEIQVAVALYDDPLNFRRSVHTENRQGRVALDDGESMPANRLPAPVSLCVPSGRGATFALHGWDNDDGSGDLLANDFDDKGDDDELLVGFQRRFRAGLPTGVQVARSDDLEVRYRVGRRRPPALPCPPEVLPPIPAATASGPAQIRGGLADIGRSWRASRDR